MSDKKEKAILFAALKCIEALYQDGHIPEYMFKNILDEYAGKIDLADFNILIKKKKGE